MQQKGNQKIYDKNTLAITSNEIFSPGIREFIFPDVLPIILTRVKRVYNAETLVGATAKSDYTYWLSQEDIAEIARIDYNYFRGTDEGNNEFEILGSMSQLHITLESFQLKIKTNQLAIARLTLIMNLENLHWVTLVIAYKNSMYVGYYVDSKNNPMPPEYFQILFDQFLIRPLINLSPGFIQQKDDFNCGLWALENTADLNQMIDQNQSTHWIIDKLKRPRNKEYFDGKRVFLSEKLKVDPVWCERHSSFFDELNTQRKSLQSSIFSTSNVDSEHSNAKRLKTNSIKKEQEQVIRLLEIFTETFMSAFTKRLGAYHLISKDERLTEEALRIELKTGITGALLGIGIAQSLIGSIPSLVASMRMVSSKYYVSKIKAQKITKIFSELKSAHLDLILAEVAVDIFHSFESQFMQVTDKAGDKVAMEKLAEDAVDRILNALDKHFNMDRFISKELIEQSMLKGPSEKFFDPNVKQARLRISGYIIQSKEGDKINTANLYEKTGLVEFSLDGQLNKFYAIKERPYTKYGYRRLFDWEKEVNGELKESLKILYLEKQLPQEKDIFQFLSRRYYYILHANKNQAEARRILDKIKNRYSSQPIKPYENKKPLYFNLRKPVKNFSGRIKMFEVLHRTLMSERTTAIVPAWSTLSISSSSPVSSPDSEASSGSQLSISGLGGIGKTQLALRYAELYAHHYDHNVLWINAETKENLDYSFYQLAIKLQIIVQDQYGQKKNIENIIEEVYDYFSDRKSLFIFDNVENYRAIEAYLPKSRVGNKPTVLITSRYSNWSNVATTLMLHVFTEQETEEFIKKSLNLSDHIRYEGIQELNQLLQGLPLALQQALAYIKLRKKTEASFSLQHYIALYKEKGKGLLTFNFSNFSNDPYLKTVFTTWLVTLDKIKVDPLGKNAIEILNIMAYLYPDSISNKKIYYLNHIDHDLTIDDLDAIIHLLNSYSMINFEKGGYTIHRLVQQVLRLNLEKNKTEFEVIVKKTQQLIWHWQYAFKKDEETIFHYLHFLLYMSEHTDLIFKVMYSHPEKTFFDNLLLQDVKYSNYFFDLAYLKFSKEKFLKFLGDAVAYYLKLGLVFNLSEIFNYIEKKKQKGILSMENIKYSLEHFHHMRDSILKIKRYSTIPSKKENQKKSVKVLFEFKQKIFGDKYDLYDECVSHSQKRSFCLSEEERNKLKAIRNSQLKSHFEKIGQISRYINAAMMTKDTVAALVQGHFDEVAINLGLITSSTFFGELSNSVFTQGKNLASGASLLEKNLGLGNKKVLQILWNEEIVSVGKRKFLGKAMQVASPFVSKATSIFFAYNLKNEIQAYKAGNTEVLPNIVSNSLILGIDGIEASIEGAEFLEIIIGVSAFTGPIGEWIALLAWIGSEAYIAEQQVAAIEKYVHLSRGEKFFESLLSILHQAPLEYMQLKANNGQLVELAINFLKSNTAFQRYIFSSFHFKEDLSQTRKVFLNEKIEFARDDSNPDKPAEGDLFCLVAAPPPYKAAPLDILDGAIAKLDSLDETIITSYLCHKALGVSYALNRTGNVTFVNLGEGEDEVIAFSQFPTLFLVQNGKKSYQGSDFGNIFDLQGNFITGRLQGGKGTDILLLDHFYPENSDYVLLDASGSLCGKKDSPIQHVPPLCPDKNKIQIDTIEQIYGRKNKSDIIYLDHSISFIDGYGGKNKTHPDNFFISKSSKQALKFVLRSNTLITFLTDTIHDAIAYRIPLGEIGETWIQYYNSSMQHLFFECAIHAIDSIRVENNTAAHISVQAHSDSDHKTFSITLSDRVIIFNNQTKNLEQLYKNIYFYFNDMEVKLINNNALYGREILDNNKTVDEKISLYSVLANRLEKSFSIQLLNNITLSIGQKNKHEIFYVNSAFESHLIGNGGENVYIILPGNETIFPLPRINLYDTSEEDSNELIELIDTLDLREIVKKYKQIYPKALISFHVFSSENDLILTLSNSVYSPTYSSLYDTTCFLPWLTIQLKNALFNDTNGYQKLDIVLDTIPKNIVPFDENFWTLRSVPLLFTADKKIIIVNNDDIEEETEIIILKNIGNFAFFRDEMDLILTNALTSTIDYCTIICKQFYQNLEMKKKILSATFKFFDREVHPQSYQKEIDHATHFQQLSQLYLTNVSEPIIRSFLKTFHIIPSVEDEQEKLHSQIVRRKRQINRKEDRISAIAGDYLNKYDQANSKNKTYPRKKSIKQKKNKAEKTSPSIVRQEKSKSVIGKNNHHDFKRKKTNYFDQNKSNLSIKLLKEKPRWIPASPKVESTRLNEKLTKNSSFTKKSSFFKEKTLTYHGNFTKTIKTTAVSPQLTYKNNQSSSKQSNRHPASYTEQPNLHNTLMFIDFIAKAIKGPPKSLSYNKKLNKTIKKAEKYRNNAEAKVFEIKN